MSKLPQKPGLGGKAPVGKTPASGATSKGADPKHLPREFK